ncbi:kazrin isoform X1 [Vespula squamosa]|uniref:Kazrin isoform X1 n=1 Tax=Vespula squamosa TaxID=30214 RepID=A0ABD2C2N3_VESSQ
MKALYGILEDKERELRDFIRNYEQRMRENEATLGRFQQQKGDMSSEERERERERGRWSLLRAVGNEADRSLSLASCLADKEVALSHVRATIKELQRQLMEGGGGGACLSDQDNGVGVTSNMSGGCTDAISSGGQAGDRGSCSADSGVHAQTKLFVMTEKNAGTGARLDRELERGREESVILRGESCDVVPSTSSSEVAALNDNGATITAIWVAVEDGKRLRTVLIAAQLRRDVRPATSHSPCGSPGEKTRRSCALNRDKTRLGESRSRSVSPDRGSSNRTSFLHRDCSDLSGIERLRISTNPDSLRSQRVVRRIRRPTFVRRSLIMTYDRRKKMNQDRLSGKFFMDLRRQRRSKVGARLSDLHGSGSSGGSVELTSARSLLLEN